MSDADFQRIPGLLLDLYTHFVSLFALRLNTLKLVHIIVKVSQQHTDPKQAIDFLNTAKKLLENSVTQKNSFLAQIGAGQGDEEEKKSDGDSQEKKTPLSPEQLLLREPILFLDSAVGQLSLQAGNMDKAKEYMEGGLQMLDQIEEVSFLFFFFFRLCFWTNKLITSFIIICFFFFLFSFCWKWRRWIPPSSQVCTPCPASTTRCIETLMISIRTRCSICLTCPQKHCPRTTSSLWLWMSHWQRSLARVS